MKYCVQYNSRFRHLKEIDEVILPYEGKGDNLVEFVNETFNKSQRIIIDVAGSVNLNKIVPSIRLLISQGWNTVILTDFEAELKEDIPDIPFFFKVFPHSLEEVTACAVSGATDVYIVEELGFRLADLKKIKEKFNIKYRVFPNIAQSSKLAKNFIPSISKFWIRPEDTPLYEDYIDVFEILGGEDNSRLSVIYEIYKQEQWLGNLNNIILDFKDDEIPNTGMNPHFAEMRINCGKRCMYSACNLCPQMGLLANGFNEVGLEVIKPRKKSERTEEEKQAILDRLKTKEEE